MIAQPCPLCVESRTELISDRARFGAPADYRLCLGCGLILQGPGSEQNSSSECYTSGKYFKTNWVESPRKLHERLLPVGRDRVLWLAQYLDAAHARILEIGSGSAGFLACASERGWTVRGVEPDPAMAAFSRDELLLDVLNERWEDLRGEEGYDVVASFHVIEHLRDPGAVLEFAKSALRPGGLLYLETPDNLHPWTVRPRWYDWFDSGHVISYHFDALSELLSRHGFGKLVVDSRCPDLRIIAVRGAAMESRKAKSRAAEVREVMKSFRRHHWWRRWFQKVWNRLSRRR